MEAERERAAIWEVDRTTGRSASMPAGFAIRPECNGSPRRELWAIVNERDEIGPNLVPDYLTSIKDGGFYGWPYSYYGQHLDPRVSRNGRTLSRAIKPDYALSSHVAPFGLAMYTANSLPADYRGGAFVSEHGSWDRTPLNGYKVVFVPFSGGLPRQAEELSPVSSIRQLRPRAAGRARGRSDGSPVDRRRRRKYSLAGQPGQTVNNNARSSD